MDWAGGQWLRGSIIPPVLLMPRPDAGGGCGHSASGTGRTV